MDRGVAAIAKGLPLILQQGQPDNYGLATGEQHPAREFVRLAFNRLGVYVRRWRPALKKLMWNPPEAQGKPG
jgi:GDP-D-mannose dehydratase